MSAENAIEIDNVSKSFGPQWAVRDLNWSVSRGGIHGFIGPNGSGKTTTLRMILRIYQPDHGRIVVLGASHGRTADDRVGYLPEERGLYKRMRVNDLLVYYARLKGCYDCQPKIDRWLERLDAGEWGKKRIDSLSKGMAQKIQFISAVIAEPQLLILDEPFSGLDPVNMERLKDAILEVQKQGTTIIFSTHDMEVSERMCDRVFMICKGQKVLDGTIDEIKDQFASRCYEVRFDQSIELKPGVDFATTQETNGFWQVQLTPDTYNQVGSDSGVLQWLQQFGPINHFRTVRPTLHDIFVQIAER